MVICNCRSQSLQDGIYPLGLIQTELRILQISVVGDLRQRPQSLVLEANMFERGVE